MQKIQILKIFFLYFNLVRRFSYRNKQNWEKSRMFKYRLPEEFMSWQQKTTDKGGGGAYTVQSPKNMSFIFMIFVQSPFSKDLLLYPPLTVIYGGGGIFIFSNKKQWIKTNLDLFKSDDVSYWIIRYSAEYTSSI